MRVWLTIPSARPLDQLEPVLIAWRERGYKIALVRQGEPTKLADLLIPTDTYLGWAPSINMLTAIVFRSEPDCDWCVGGGDDTLPDPARTAEAIAEECSRHFEGEAWPTCESWKGGYGSAAAARAAGQPVKVKKQALWSADLARMYSSFGVMQPIGDKAAWPNSHIENFAGSPWLGREWCKRAYQGNGPLFPYHHSWADEELQNVARKYGVFWQRPDLTQAHMHHTRPGGMPRTEFASMIDEDYRVQKSLFLERKANGWPGSEPL
jgi:hypothetical protein